MEAENTGFWMFVCNPKIWQIDLFLQSGNLLDTFTITDWQKDWFRPGQLGVIRVGKDNRTKTILQGRAKLKPGIYAIVKILSVAKLSASSDENFWTDPKDRNKECYRVDIEYLDSFLGNPLLVEDLKETNISVNDPVLIEGFQASSYPIKKESYDKIESMLKNRPSNSSFSRKEIDPYFFNQYFDMFLSLVRGDNNKEFTSFLGNKYLEENEGYKDIVFAKAREKLNCDAWNFSDIGTGNIIQHVYEALLANKNLVPWQNVDSFNKKLSETQNMNSYESVLFDLYTNRKSEKYLIEPMKQYFGNHYSLIAYLFFIKDNSKFLPISTAKFEKAFKKLGVDGFKLSGECSWTNYCEYNSFVKSIRNLLTEEGVEDVSLLHAHSFVWIISDIEETLKEKGISAFQRTKNLDVYNQLDKKERTTIIQSRIGQGTYRKTLIDYWQGCSLTGCTKIEILVASHIKPWCKCDVHEAIDGHNGLLLIPNLDALFDSGLISFNDDGQILVSKNLSEQEMKILGIRKDMKIIKSINEKQKPYLQYHRENIFKR